MKFKTLVIGSFISLISLGFTSSAGAAWDWDRGSFSSTSGMERRYVPPLSNALFNETPYITTEASLWYWYQIIPDDAITSGGQINLYAAQARLALTDRLGLIATKDGFADFHFGNVLSDTEGGANIAIGFKYALIQSEVDDYIVTAGARYEIPVGDIDTSGISLQGHGDGFIDLFVSGAKHWGKFGVQGNIGTNLAIDGSDNTSQLHYSIHFDYELLPKFYPILEFNGISTIDEGKRVAVGVEGHDVLNLGSSNVGTTLTLAAGFRYLLTDNVQLGAAWEETVSDRDDLLDSRLYVNLLLHF